MRRGIGTWWWIGLGIVLLSGCTDATIPTPSELAASPASVPPAPSIAVALPALTSSGGVDEIARMMTVDGGFTCTSNIRFVSCSSPSDTVRLAAWYADADGAASEIIAAFAPDAQPAEVDRVLELLDRVAPGLEAAARPHIADPPPTPQYLEVGRANVTIQTDEWLSIALRPRR